MPPDKQRRRRAVSSCTQCYSKKQKCNHQYPCNHCARRRRPELCSYTWPDPGREETSSQAAVDERSRLPSAPGSRSLGTGVAALPRHGPLETSLLPQLDMLSRPFEASLPSCFGYFEGSHSNLLGLMSKYDLLDTEELGGSIGGQVPEKLIPAIMSHFRLLPKRPILNCLVQNFFKEVNWIHGLIYPTAFFSLYDRWWGTFSARSIENIEFGILLLRVCAYSAQFLPSRAYTADTISGVTISLVREQCHRLAIGLSRVCESAGGMRSFASVQGLCLAAAYLKNEGRIKEAWDLMGDLITTAYNLGIHLETTTSRPSNLNELEKEMGRRVFWNLYIWDRHWALVLDRSPRIHEEYCGLSYPKMRLALDTDDPAAPDAFLERTLQAQLARLWYSTLHRMKGQPLAYDPVVVEEQYDMLCREFISKLPAAFDFNSPNKQWDQLSPALALQRQTLRISIFSLLCQTYRPLLHLNQAQIDALPRYKRNLIPRHRAQLVNAATSLLDSVAQLHHDMGGNQTRYFLISFYTFEAAMLLTMHLLSAENASCGASHTGEERQSHDVLDPVDALEEAAPLNSTTPSVARCRAEIVRALERLDMLREVSPIAELGARKVHQMVARLDLLEQEKDAGEDNVSDSPPLGPASVALEMQMQAYIDEHFEGRMNLDQGGWPETLEERWVDEAINFTMDDAGTLWTETPFPDPYLDSLSS